MDFLLRKPPINENEAWLDFRNRHLKLCTQRALIILSQIHAINTNFVHNSFGVLFMIGFPQKNPYRKEIKI